MDAEDADAQLDHQLAYSSFRHVHQRRAVGAHDRAGPQRRAGRFDRGADATASQREQRVGLQREPGAQRLDRLGALEHLDLEARPREADGRAQPADAGPYDYDLLHAPSSWRGARLRSSQRADATWACSSRTYSALRSMV